MISEPQSMLRVAMLIGHVNQDNGLNDDQAVTPSPPKNQVSLHTLQIFIGQFNSVGDFCWRLFLCSMLVI